MENKNSKLERGKKFKQKQKILVKNGMKNAFHPIEKHRATLELITGTNFL